MSFLGTGNYSSCSYSLNGKTSGKTPYIQEALMELTGAHYTEEDRVTIFLTEKARNTHWDLLMERLASSNNPATIRGVTIPSGHSEEEVWEIFSIIYKNINEGDRISLDVTHGFRTLPMLAVVLLNYTRFLKHTVIRGIYYGAFEAVEDNIAPVFNLTGFDRLQQWSIGADHLVHYGNAEKIHDIIKEEVKRQETSKTEDNAAGPFASEEIIRLDKNLRDFCMDISTLRGKRVYEGGRAEDIKKVCRNIKRKNISYQAISPIIDSIADILKPYSKKSVQNLILAVEWCIDHNLTQQGITLLQEALITIVMEGSALDHSDIKSRKIVGDLVHMLARGIPQSSWRDELKENITLLRPVMRFSEMDRLSSVYANLSKLRNDINHAGFTDDTPASAFKEKLKGYHRDCKEFLG